ncbi:TetR/AcrR family transcriptional regulator [Corynebacterium oculi]|uniref:HTH-type transcriptional repressor KstR2 n=1 Tax=Corynebacterium oculi TaxID=1544416 RepID=A0A0N8VZQ2_9CORY|nr:TetR/AcrR family transcriptional regulator [Corynebacterium oculi]KQB84530.1 HTH-type transcriptional repressor KstR2 [Corynebacterium oculi]
MRADAEANHREILRVAARLIAEQGTGVSLRTIAHTAGVGIGTLYRHFDSREALIEGVVASIFYELDLAAEHFLAHRRPTAEEWRAYAHALAGTNLGALGGAFQTDEERKYLEPLAGERVRVLARIEEVLRRASAHGFIAPEVTVPRFLLGIVQFTRPLPEKIGSGLTAEMSWVLDTFLRGLQPPQR